MGYKCVNPDDSDAFWPYCPSLAPSIIFAFLFAASSGVHFIQAIVHKKPFAWVIIMGALWETAGYIFRSASVLDQKNKNKYTYQSLFVMLAPLWINAFAYMCLGRLVHMFLGPNEIDRHVLKIPARRFTLIFVLLDVTAFLIQAIGGVMASVQSNSTSRIELGFHIYEGGIGFQQAVIIGFSSLAIRFHLKLRTVEPRSEDSLSVPRRARSLIYALYTALSLITIRIVVNLVKDNSGKDGALLKKEWIVFVFDAVPMLLALIAFHVVHPGRILKGPMSQFPKGEEKRTAKIELKEAKRFQKAEREATQHKIESARFMHPPSQGSFNSIPVNASFN